MPAHGRSASACARAPCTSAAPAASGSPGSSAAHVSRDEDGDWDFNSDENAIRYYGKPAGTREREAIVTALRRYYQAIATGDTTRACSLIDPGFGRELLGASGLRGATSFRETCASFLSNMLLGHGVRRHGAHRVPRVIAVRVAGGGGYVLLDFQHEPVSEMPIANSAGSWRMASVFDVGLP